MCGSFFVKEKVEKFRENQICIQGFVVLGDTNTYVTHVKFKVYKLGFKWADLGYGKDCL